MTEKGENRFLHAIETLAKIQRVDLKDSKYASYIGEMIIVLTNIREEMKSSTHSANTSN